MRLSQQHHIFTQLKRILVLLFVFVLAPSAGLLSVGILVLVFGSTPHDIVFGVLILSLVVAMALGCAAMLVYVFRGAELARLQTDFVARVSHDLLTPLTSIRLFVETLQLGRAGDAEKMRQCLDIVQAETGRLTTMIERLLHWGRLESGRHIYDMAEHEVREIVEGALAAFSTQLLESPAQIAHEIPPDLPPVRVDPASMTEAILNLLQNAHRYTGPEKRITVRCDRKKNNVAISVIDNGPGIPQSERRDILKKFYRGKDSIARGLSGSGLGLAIVNHIVRAHRGRLTVDSEAGSGATFTILLPALLQREQRGGETADHRG